MDSVDVSGYIFETLREGGEFDLYRGRRPGTEAPILLLTPGRHAQGSANPERLEHEYSLARELESRWAVRPVALTHYQGRRALVLEDSGGDPLDSRLVGSRFELAHFLSVAAALATALGHMHRTGLVHNDIRPANLMLDSAGYVRITGFGLAWRPPSEPRALASDLFVDSLAYMAPEQTGRVDRAVDARSDLYSLGVTLYEMLTGVLPFSATDPLEWIHCHVARPPPPPSEHLDSLPDAVGAIVLKLLEKNADERYQTAAALEADLGRCLHELQTRGQIDEFPLGEHDVSNRFVAGQKLYGREAEAQALVAAFDEVSTDGKSRVVLLSGHAGIGKSAVLGELRRTITSARCLFTLGKAEQYGPSTPHATLSQAIRSLVRQLLIKKEAEVADWRVALLDALGTEGQLIINTVPELALVIGEQPSLVERPSRDAQERFYNVLQRLLGVFARPGHTLILCLDDLQWLEVPTLEVIERLVTDPKMGYLLVVGTYRDSEVDASHPLLRTLQRIRSSAAKLTEINLAPLAREDIGQLVADGMRVSLPRVQRLADFVFEKTGGNPFFTIQLITALAEEGLLVFDAGSGAWHWDIGRMRTKGISSDVASVMASKLGRLPDKTKEVLARMALFGGTAEFATLARVSSGSGADLHVALWDAIQAGLVVCEKDNYSFAHDRIQEAAYSLIREEERPAAHLAIGRSLISQKTHADLNEKIFEIVRPFEHGSALIHSREERDQVAELNLLAGKRARSAAAYASALAYFETGLAWLGPDGWERCPGLAFRLELQRATCEFLIGATPAAGEHLAGLSRRPLALEELPALVDIEVKFYTLAGESGSAVEACLGYLRRFDLALPLHPMPSDLRAEYDRLLRRVEGQTISGFIDLPLMVEPRYRALVDVLSSLMDPAGTFDPKLTALAMLHMVNLSLEHGNCDPSCAAYAGMGQFLGMLFGDYRTGYEFVALAVELVEKRGLTRFKSRVFGCYGALVAPWLRHIREGYSFSARASEVPPERDLSTWSSYAWWSRTATRLDSGDPLDDVHAEAQRALAFVTKLGFAFAVDLVTGPLRLTRMLLGVTPRWGSLDEDGVTEQSYEQYLEANRLLTHATVRYWIRKLQARFYADEYVEALEAAAKAKMLLGATLRSFEFAEYHFFAALAQAALFPGLSPLGVDLDTIVSHHTQLVAWSEDCRSNFADRAALVGAEIARLTGRELDAERLYEEAIQLAQQHGFVQNEGLSNELAARFHATRGFETIANAYLVQARDCYLRWGARGKARHLHQRHPQLDRDRGQRSVARSGPPPDTLDIDAVLKASQALSGEIVLDSLIETLMRLVIEHAGAERGCLILLRNGERQIAAEAAVVAGNVAVNRDEKAVSSADLPESALEYVIRTRERLILDDASANGLFARDEYVRRHRPKSVLCMPIVKQSTLVGALYLENNLTARAFTPSRITVLEFLASHAAISLENAYLYADLQRSEAFLAEGQRLSHTGSWSFHVITGEVRWSSEHYRIMDWDPLSDAMPTWDLAMQKVHAEDRQYLEQVFDVARRERSELTFDFRLDLGSRVKYLHGHGRPVLGESGEVESFVGTTMDVTERKHAEDALRNALADLQHVNRLTTMGELAASIAHEVNQPLAAIVANAASCLAWLAKEPPNLERARKVAERISRDGHEAAEIIRSVRSMAKKTLPEMVLLDVDEVIREVLDVLHTELRRHEVHAVIELPAEAPPIRGDRVQLRQVMVNLVTNGIEAMKGVQRQGILRVSRNNDQDDQVVIAVEDCGTGIEAQVAERIFDPLFTTKREGLGMGLAICRSIVEAHGGRLWVSPCVPHGSIFRFSVPRAAPGSVG